MSTYRLGLYFREIDGPVPGRPISHVYVKNPLSAEYADAVGMVLLTPREYGPEVVENQIDLLIEELREIKREARARYAKYDERLSRHQEPGVK